MSESGNVAVTMAVDTKKYGIRIHKALFRVVRHIIGGGFRQNKISTVTLFDT